MRKNSRKRGFLPMPTTIGDRIFIGVVTFIAIHFLWMRFMESYVSLWVATILSAALMIVIIRQG